MRPQLIQPINCRNILLDGFTIKSGPFWTIQVVYGENVLVRNLTILTEGPNNDGINADSTRNMIIEDCRLSIGDDGVAIKSGLNEDGWRVNVPSENIIVRRLNVQGGHAGVSIGSDMSGNVRNVFIHDCEFQDLWRGFWIKSTRGRGGVVENIYYTDTKITHTLYEALGITTAYSAWFGSDTGKAPSIRNITYENIDIPWTNKAISFEGLADAPIENVTVRDSRLLSTLPSQFSLVHGLTIENVELAPYFGDHVAEFWNCRDVVFKNVDVPSGASDLMLLHGTGNSEFSLIGGKIPDSMHIVKTEDGVDASVVTRSP
jgi:polygalacturonase